MNLTDVLVFAGWVGMVTGIGLLSVPWALIIGGASLMAFGLYAAHRSVNARTR